MIDGIGARDEAADIVGWRIVGKSGYEVKRGWLNKNEDMMRFKGLWWFMMAGGSVILDKEEYMVDEGYCNVGDGRIVAENEV